MVAAHTGSEANAAALTGDSRVVGFLRPLGWGALWQMLTRALLGRRLLEEGKTSQQLP